MKKAVFNRVLAVFLVVLGAAGFVFLAGVSVKNEIASEKPVVSVDFDSKVECILKAIEDNQIQQAIERINAEILPDEKLDLVIKLYFENFITCYNQYNHIKNNHTKNTEDGETEIETVFFLNNSVYLIDFLKKNSSHNQIEASRLAEIVPYFFIRFYEQKQKKNTDLFYSYVKNFTADDILSEKTAEIFCLYVQSLYKVNRRNKDFLKEEMSLIKKYQEKFSSEIGENGIYEKSSMYLAAMYKFLLRQANRKFWWSFESSPEFSI